MPALQALLTQYYGKLDDGTLSYIMGIKAIYLRKYVAHKDDLPNFHKLCEEGAARWYELFEADWKAKHGDDQRETR
jgi:hypothetical protein